jgi:hypothetical protein
MTTPDLAKLAEAWLAAERALDTALDQDDWHSKVKARFAAKAAFLTALSTLTARVAEAEKARGEALSEAAFLLARLSEIDWSGDIDSLAREYNGHVEPSIERLRALTVGDRDKGGES